MSAGKGDSPRPVDMDTYGKNYESIFRKPKQDSNIGFCECGVEMVNHFFLGVICEDCELKYQDYYQ
jgi:hypothetical protein